MAPTLSNPPISTPMLQGNRPSPVWERWLQQLRDAAATAGGLALAAVGSSPNANGASLASRILNLQPADGTHPGVVTALAQAFGGLKTFNAGLALAAAQAITFGDTTTQSTAASPTSMTAFGSTPNANGGTIVANALALQPADGTHPGGVSILAQTLGGKKTFAAGLDAGSNAITNVADPSNAQDASTKNYTNNHGSMILPLSGSATTVSSANWLFPAAGSTATCATGLAVASSLIIPFAYTIKAIFFRVTAGSGAGTNKFQISKNGAAAVDLTGTFTGTSGSQAITGNNTGSAGDFIEISITNAQVAGSSPPGQTEISLWIQPT